MQRVRNVLLIALACLGLASCFTSKDALIGPADAAFPAERIVFAEVSRPDDRQTWTRQGDVYAWRPEANDDRQASLRLKSVDGDVYVVQLEFPGEKGTERLYGVITVDLAAKRVFSYATVRPDAFEARPGLGICDTSVCIEDIDAYVAYAKGLIASGASPDAEYVIVEME